MPARLIPADKGTHYVVGSLITLLALPAGWEVALTACFAAAVFREVYGFMTGGEFSFADIAATMLGSLAVLGGAGLGMDG